MWKTWVPGGRNVLSQVAVLVSYNLTVAEMSRATMVNRVAPIESLLYSIGSGQSVNSGVAPSYTLGISWAQNEGLAISSQWLQLPFAGQPYGSGGCSCLAGSYSRYPSLCRVTKRKSSCAPASDGVCANGELRSWAAMDMRWATCRNKWVLQSGWPVSDSVSTRLKWPFWRAMQSVLGIPPRSNYDHFCIP